ncbi:hypothetical protein G7062_02430 [Erysipelothrix sp. HDW6C]|uniref:hypothetical protein n=1 Tax=Erysipelothrix sp. HDW6C TaxID=2714930 RepID=UPI0014088EAB|nr:hypothetical protein [Erysipelothrix sp. HDW6C]QIK69214.1 hypothetical protein G7062_02430 [Erysipelothrix sp. HDW6C]
MTKKSKILTISLIAAVFTVVISIFAMQALSPKKSIDVLSLPSKRFVLKNPDPSNQELVFGKELIFFNNLTDTQFAPFSRSQHEIKDINVTTERLHTYYDRFYQYNDNTLILMGSYPSLPKQYGDQIIGTKISIKYGLAILEEETLYIFNLENIQLEHETLVSKSDTQATDLFLSEVIPLSDQKNRQSIKHFRLTSRDHITLSC